MQQSSTPEPLAPAPSASRNSNPPPVPAGPDAEQLADQRLLERIARGAAICAQVEQQLAQHPAPGLETLIKLYRVMILKLSAQKEVDSDLLKLANDLMKPVLDWARLEEKRKERELAERKYRDRKRAGEKRKGGNALRPETLAKIERELKLM
jgi:hypothetical protein